jgi:hypothetical protein
MRKVLCLAAGAAAIFVAGAPATAQRLNFTGASSGRPVFRNPIAQVRRGLVGPVQCAPGNRRCSGNGSGRGRRGGFGAGWIGYAYGGLIEDPESLRDQGFFAETGDAWAENGRAVYDYDRGYPYDWYRGSDAPTGAGPGPRLAAPPLVRCEIDWGGGTGRQRSAVRVCRGRR